MALNYILSIVVGLSLIFGLVVSWGDNKELFKKPFILKHLSILIVFLSAVSALTIQTYLDHESELSKFDSSLKNRETLVLGLKKARKPGEIVIVYKTGEQESKDYAESFLTLFKRGNWEASIEQDSKLNLAGLVLCYPKEDQGNQFETIWQAFSRAKINSTTDVDLTSMKFRLTIGNSAL